MSIDEAIATAVAKAQEPLFQRLAQVESILRKIERSASAPEPKAVWEPRSVAMKRRKVGMRTLNALVETGRIRAKRVPGPGGEHVLLATADLDQIYPVRIAGDAKESRVDIDAA